MPLVAGDEQERSIELHLASGKGQTAFPDLVDDGGREGFAPEPIGQRSGVTGLTGLCGDCLKIQGLKIFCGQAQQVGHRLPWFRVFEGFSGDKHLEQGRDRVRLQTAETVSSPLLLFVSGFVPVVHHSHFGAEVVEQQFDGRRRDCTTAIEIERAGRYRRLAARFIGYVVGKVLQHRSGGLLQQLEGMQQHTPLKCRIVGDTKGSAKREADPQSPRWSDLFAVFADQADLRGADTLVLQVVGEPADGARAVRSDRYQQDGAYPVSLE